MATFMVNQIIMTSPTNPTTTTWDKQSSMQDIPFNNDTIHAQEEEKETEESEVSLQYEDDFAILRAADPQVAEKFHASVGNKRKGPSSRNKIMQSSVEVLVLAPSSFSKSVSSQEKEDQEEDKEATLSTINTSFDSPIFVKPTFQPATKNEENTLLSSNYRNNETSFYGSKHDVFASSPRSVHSDSSSCTSSKDDGMFVSPTGPKLKPKNLVKTVVPGMSVASSKRVGPTTTPRSQRVPVDAALLKKKNIVSNNHLSPKQRASSLSPIRVRVSPTATVPKTAQTTRARSLKRGEQQQLDESPTLTSEKQLLKEKLLRLMDANQQQQHRRPSAIETKSVSTKLTPLEVDDLVGNVSQHKRTPATTGGGGKLKMKIKSDLLKIKLEQDCSNTSLPLSTSSRCDGTTITTSTSASSKPKSSPTKQKRIIKIRKSDLEGTGEQRKANLDDLLDKAASEWKATLKRSSKASGTNWKASSTTAMNGSQSQSVAANSKEAKRPFSRSRREKRTVTEEEETPITQSAANDDDENRDSSRSRSRRASPRSYEKLGSDDGNASNDHVEMEGPSRTRSKSKSRRGSQTSPERRKSLFDDLKGLASPALRKGDKSTRSTRTAARRPSLMASVAKKFGSERKERSISTPRASSPEKEKTRSLRSLSNPRSQRAARTVVNDDDDVIKRGSTSGPFSLQGLQKMLGFSPTSLNKEKVIPKADKEIAVDAQGSLLLKPMESPRSDPSSSKKTLLERIRIAGVTDEMLLALSEQGLVIVERKARIPK